MSEVPAFTPPAGFIEADSALRFVRLFVPAPEAEQVEQAQQHKCRSCGADAGWDGVAGGLKCNNCGAVESVEVTEVGWVRHNEFTLEALEGAEQGWGVDRREQQCDSCGGTLAIDAEQLSERCPFCGSHTVHIRAAEESLRPRYVAPFRLDRAELADRVAAWLAEGSWMFPSRAGNLSAVDNFVGIYLPFWRFNSKVEADWQALVGTNEAKVIESSEGPPIIIPWVSWETERGKVELDLDAILVPGTEHLNPTVIQHIEPFDLAAASEYDPKLLAGWPASGWKISLPDAWRTGRKRIRALTTKAAKDEVPGDYRASFTVDIDFDDESWQCLLLPIYVSSYKYRGKTYNIVVNGQTGAVGGSRPVRWSIVYLWMLAYMVPGLAWVSCVGVPLSWLLIGIFLMFWPGCRILKWGWRRQGDLYAAALHAEASR